MKRVKSHFQNREPLLEGILQSLRFRRVEKLITPKSSVLDLGCGYYGSFLNKLSGKISSGWGYDVSVSRKIFSKNIRLKTISTREISKLPSNHFDFVTMLAVIEHLKNPEFFISAAYKALKSSGKIILTTPSPKSKTILEILAFRLGLVSPLEISDHKKYYNSKNLKRLLIKSGFENNKIRLQEFELGFNILAEATK